MSGTPTLLAPQRTQSDGGSASDRPPAISRRPEDEEARPYVLAGELGKGSFAVVYKGYHEVCAHIISISESNEFVP